MSEINSQIFTSSTSIMIENEIRPSPPWLYLLIKILLHKIERTFWKRDSPTTGADVASFQVVNESWSDGAARFVVTLRSDTAVQHEQTWKPPNRQPYLCLQHVHHVCATVSHEEMMVIQSLVIILCTSTSLFGWLTHKVISSFQLIRPYRDIYVQSKAFCTSGIDTRKIVKKLTMTGSVRPEMLSNEKGR